MDFPPASGRSPPSEICRVRVDPDQNVLDEPDDTRARRKHGRGPRHSQPQVGPLEILAAKQRREPPRLDELNERLGTELPEDEDYDTLGGFVFHTLGRVPKAGEQFVRDGMLLTVLEATDRTVDRVRIALVPADAAVAPES